MKYLLDKNKLSSKQINTLNTILSLGTERPQSPIDFSNDLKKNILSIISENMKNWSNGNFYFNKNIFSMAEKCDGLLLASKSNINKENYNPNIIIGNLSHKAIQISYTHGIKNVNEIIANLIDSIKDNDSDEDRYYNSLSFSKQSDIISQVTSRVTSFIDDWPTLQPMWSPRFEENISSKVGKILFASRIDLVIGRPNNENKRTMLLVDFKTGNLNESHQDEAYFYALLSTLRHDIMPWRSIVYSLASGEYTELDLTSNQLYEFSTKIANSVNKSINLLLEKNLPVLTPGDHCNWCPVSNTCVSSQYKLS